MSFTAEEKFQEALREVKMRECVYGQLVNNGGMAEQTAKRKIAIMMEIAADYDELAKGERLL
jgi:hypothetical protein